ncbi:hypothetical protein DL1_02775 [Thioclava dalianensis]|uniref:Uncharacterized protein n=1 Tax=Thioclava dalianensis TaxID=1185766 RepID=A0A074TDK7_9RHOB|nr:DUF6478 family protein [Thioclava dalianensis]KEP69754.1 hypothetical protein DL1_02775 [Thioclava dalianensis]SFM94285.1 hypothetical protein SAMN05216224_1011050 [Thioclava dalianensis]
MTKAQRSSLLDRLTYRRSVRRWRQAARDANALEIGQLPRLRSEARGLRRQLDNFLHQIEGRLQLPRIGADSVPAPPESDWTWRPELWRGPVSPFGVAGAQNRAQLGRELTLFHDCAHSEVTLRQMRNLRETDLAPFGLRMDVLGFEGSFLSFVLDLPDSAIQGLQLNHLIRLEMLLELERPLEIFCRLNIKHGPNSDQLVREMPVTEGGAAVEFDLAYMRLNEKRLEKAWIDVIFERPAMNQVLLRDLHFSRYPRAEM